MEITHTTPTEFTYDEFYDESTEIGKRRKYSGEMDFGVWWRWSGYSASSGGWPRFRVSCVQDTGEVYIIRMAGSNEVYGKEIRVIAVIDKPREVVYSEANRIMGENDETGVYEWAERCGKPASLDWVFNQWNVPRELYPPRPSIVGL